MTTTPLIWKRPSIENVTTNAVETEVVALSDGNFAVIWAETDDLSIGSDSGHDIIGRVFNPLGQPVGSEKLLVGGSERNNGDFDVVAGPDGGIALTYVTDFGFSNFVNVAEFSDGLLHRSTKQITTIADDNGNGAPSIAVHPDGDYQVTYQRVTSDNDFHTNTFLVGAGPNGTVSSMGSGSL